MPYIKQDRREVFKNELERLVKQIENKGELTYCIYKLGVDYLKYRKMCYQNISDVCASMKDSEHEVRRRILDNYEDKKIKENGDIR